MRRITRYDGSWGRDKWKPNIKNFHFLVSMPQLLNKSDIFALWAKLTNLALRSIEKWLSEALWGFPYISALLDRYHVGNQALGCHSISGYKAWIYLQSSIGCHKIKRLPQLCIYLRREPTSLPLTTPVYLCQSSRRSACSSCPLDDIHVDIFNPPHVPHETTAIWGKLFRMLEHVLL